MPSSGTVTAGSAALASQYNNLRADVLNVSTGHTHTGASENGAKVAATGVSSGTATDGFVLTADGSGGAAFEALAAAGADFQEFTSSGSWVKPAGKTAVYVFALGAGGGGASGSRGANGGLARSGGPGGGGGHSSRWYAASTLAGTVTVTIGAGGAGGTAMAEGSNSVAGNEGSYGGETTFGTVSVGLGGPTGKANLGAVDFNFRTPVGNTEWGTPATYSGNGGTTDAGDPAEVAAAFYSTFAVGQPIVNIGVNSVRALTRSASGGQGGYASNSTSARGGAAGGRGFGGNGTIVSGGDAALAGGTAANGSAGSVSSAGGGLGHGGGGGGGGGNAVPGNGGAGYRGGGGGGGGAVSVSSGSADRATGAGGAGGDGYVLVVSV